MQQLRPTRRWIHSDRPDLYYTMPRHVTLRLKCNVQDSKKIIANIISTATANTTLGGEIVELPAPAAKKACRELASSANRSRIIVQILEFPFVVAGNLGSTAC